MTREMKMGVDGQALYYDIIGPDVRAEIHIHDALGGISDAFALTAEQMGCLSSSAAEAAAKMEHFNQTVTIPATKRMNRQFDKMYRALRPDRRMLKRISRPDHAPRWSKGYRRHVRRQKANGKWL